MSQDGKILRYQGSFDNDSNKVRKMIVRSQSYEELESDIADIFDSVPEYIKEKLLEYDKCCPPTDDKTLSELLDLFIDREANLDEIDSLFVYHLTVCEDKLSILKPLDYVLTDEKSAVREFLAENNVRFIKREGQLILYYNGQKQSLSSIISNNKLLARRLGYFNNPDCCINGFSFWKDIEKTSEGYYEHLERGPEILQNLDNYLDTNLASLYRNKYHYYGLVFEVPFSQAIFYDCPSLTEKDKKRFFIQNALKSLLGYYLGHTYNGSNPSIHISEGECAKVRYKILAKE